MDDDSGRFEEGPGGLVTAAATASIVTLLALCVLAAVLWTRLPERIPLHFGSGGKPTRWGPATLVNWFTPTVIATVLAAVMFALQPLMTFFARKHPKLMNVPSKREFLKLPEDARLRAMRPMTALLWGMPAPVNGLFLYMVWGTYAVAVGERATLPATWVFVFLAAIFAWIAYTMLVFRRAVRNEIARGDRGDSDAAPEKNKST